MASENPSQIGAQLFTIREFTQTLPDIAKALGRIREIGYTAIQISKFGPVDPKEVAKICEDNGLTVAATHVNWPDILADIDKVIDTHQIWNCKHPAIGGLPKDVYFSAEGLKRFLGELPPVVEKFKAAGMDFSYHNHSHELVRYEGETWLKGLYSRTSADGIKAEVDVYWIAAGGGDPAQWIRDIGPRQSLVHVKDMVVLPDRTQRFAEVGEGNLNWSNILEACREVGVEWYLVEQDDCYGADPFDCLATSLRNLKEMGLS